MQERVYKKPAQLAGAIRRYFAAISYDEPILRRVPVTTRQQLDDGREVSAPVLDKYGHELVAYEPVMRTEKQQAVKTVWIEPPCLPALLLAVRLTDDTWDMLRQADGFADVCAAAEKRIEIFNVQQLATARASGAKFALGCKFGWNDAAQKESGARMEFENAMQELAK